MGKITRDQTIVRKNEEAKRDKITANRKEEDLAIKETVVGVISSCGLRDVLTH